MISVKDEVAGTVKKTPVNPAALVKVLVVASEEMVTVLLAGMFSAAKKSKESVTVISMVGSASASAAASCENVDTLCDAA